MEYLTSGQKQLNHLVTGCTVRHWQTTRYSAASTFRVLLACPASPVSGSWTGLSSSTETRYWQLTNVQKYSYITATRLVTKHWMRHNKITSTPQPHTQKVVQKKLAAGHIVSLYLTVILPNTDRFSKNFFHRHHTSNQYLRCVTKTVYCATLYIFTKIPATSWQFRKW